MRQLKPCLGTHRDVLERYRPVFGFTECECELSQSSTWLDRQWDGSGPEQRVELWECECGALLWITDGVLVDVYQRQVGSRDIVRGLAASFELPPAKRAEGGS